MILKGQKRKLDPEDVEVSDPSSPLWDTQRQFVFSVSLNKYQRGQELPEPSLRRSVLIANTLRQIALEKCGAPPADEEEEAAPPSGGSFGPQAEEQENIAGESVVTAAADQEEDWGSMSMDSDFSLSAAISSILTALDSTVDGSPQAAPRAALGSLENLPGLSERGSAAAVKPGCPSNVATEDPFQDVETSLLERDMGGLGIRGGRAGQPAQAEHVFSSSPSSSSHPLSLSLNSSLKCLPSFSSFSPLPSSPSPDSASFSGQNQAREAFELEHLMEILVESWKVYLKKKLIHL